MSHTDPTQKPPAHHCPQHFCFFWRAQGSWTAPGVYANREEALAHLLPVAQAGCGCSFGQCSRDAVVPGPTDWYEPCEPALAAATLPWFYFIPSPAKLVAEFQERYVTESELLWGPRHWEHAGRDHPANEEPSDH